MQGFVYGDVVFAVNFVMNALILWGASRLSGARAPAARLAAAAAAGAVYALAAVCLDEGWVNSLPVRVAVAAMMAYVAFPGRSVWQLVRLTGYTLSFSFTVAGAAMAVWAATAGPEAWVHPVKWWALAVAAMLGACAARSAGSARARRLVGGCMNVEIGLLGGTAVVTALLDTGNRLEDPFSGEPVMVVEYGAIGCLIPPGLRRAVAEGDAEAVAAAPSGGFASRFRVLPFSALGEAAGLMVGFRPDSLVIEHDGRRHRPTRAVVAVCKGPLSPDGSYQALLHPGMMKGILDVG